MVDINTWGMDKFRFWGEGPTYPELTISVNGTFVPETFSRTATINRGRRAVRWRWAATRREVRYGQCGPRQT